MPNEIVARQTCNCLSIKGSSTGDRNDVSTTGRRHAAEAAAARANVNKEDRS